MKIAVSFILAVHLLSSCGDSKSSSVADETKGSCMIESALWTAGDGPLGNLKMCVEGEKWDTADTHYLTVNKGWCSRVQGSTTRLFSQDLCDRDDSVGYCQDGQMFYRFYNSGNKTPLSAEEIERICTSKGFSWVSAR